jgi:hypothetical protein
VLCGRDAKAVKSAAAILGWEETATDWREVVNRPDIDIVDVATPGQPRRDRDRRGQAGKVVLCEKAAGQHREGSEGHAGRGAEGGRPQHGLPQLPPHSRGPAREGADCAGDLGKIYHYRGTYLQDWILDPKLPLLWRFQKDKAAPEPSATSPPIPSTSRDSSSARSPRSRAPSRPSSRAVPSWATRAARARSRRRRRPLRGALRERRDRHDRRLAGGGRRKNYNRFEINGSKGSIAFDLERMNELELFSTADDGAVQGFRKILVTEGAYHAYIKGWWPPGHIIGYEHTFTHTVLRPPRAMAGRKKTVKPDFEDGLRNQLVLDAIERAARSRRWTKVG